MLASYEQKAQMHASVAKVLQKDLDVARTEIEKLRAENRSVVQYCRSLLAYDVENHAFTAIIIDIIKKLGGDD
jgi:hypothetical protein